MTSLRVVGLACAAGATALALLCALQERPPHEPAGNPGGRTCSESSPRSSTLREAVLSPASSDRSAPRVAPENSEGRLEEVLAALEAKWPEESQHCRQSFWAREQLARLPGGAEALAVWFFAEDDQIPDRRAMLVASLLNSAVAARNPSAARREFARDIRRAWEAMDPVTPAKWCVGYNVIRYVTRPGEWDLERVEANAWRLAESSPRDAPGYLADAASLGCDSNRLFDEVVRLTNLGLQGEMEAGTLAADVEELLDKADILLVRWASRVPLQHLERMLSSSNDVARFVGVRLLIAANPGRPDIVASRVTSLPIAPHHQTIMLGLFIKQYQGASVEHLPALLRTPGLELTVVLANVLSERALALGPVKLADLLAEGKAGWNGDVGKIVVHD